MSPLPEDSSSAARPAAIDQPEFSPEERDLLFANGAQKQSHPPLSDASFCSSRRPLISRSAAWGIYNFVRDGKKELHGCVGFALPTTPRCILQFAQTAKAAAFEDRRFPPLTREEIPDLKISLSVLSPLQPILPDEIEIGRHGLLIFFSRPPRPASPASADRARLGRHHVSGANLPQGRFTR